MSRFIDGINWQPEEPWSTRGYPSENLIGCGMDCFSQTNDKRSILFFDNTTADYSPDWLEIDVPPIWYENIYNYGSFGAGFDSSAVLITTYSIYRYDKTSYVGEVKLWDEGPAHLVGVGTKDRFVFSNIYGRVYKYYDGEITQISAEQPFTIRQLACDPSMNHIFAISESTTGSNVYYRANNTWVNVVGGKNLRQIHLHYNTYLNELQTSGVDANGIGWLYNNVTNVWTSIDSFWGSSSVFYSLSTSTNRIFGSTNIYYGNALRGIKKWTDGQEYPPGSGIH